MASASWWQSMDRSTASTPVLALKSEINTPPEIRMGCGGPRPRAGTVDRVDAFMAKCRSKNSPGRTIY
jgi:hypothetical protein